MYPRDIISYIELVVEEKANLQRGMNFKLHGKNSVILMSTRSGAPYNDETLDGGKTVIYEGHDIPKNFFHSDPKSVDQPEMVNGKLTQNGLFFRAATLGKNETVKVYEKIKPGIWVFNGFFTLTNAWKEFDGKRFVFKFKLEIDENYSGEFLNGNRTELTETRMIPSHVKMEVWKRDKGKCVICGSTDNLHFDHDLPFAKGGTSLISQNVRILCARHNLQKSDKIQ